MPAQLAAPANAGVTRNSAHKPTAPLFKPASLKPTPTPVAPALSTLPISAPQCEKALTALLAHIAKVQLEREEKDLLGEQEEKVFLIVGMKKAAKREVHKPIRLPLPHPVLDPRASPVTLFVKDPQRTYKDLLESSHISFVNRVVGLDKLRTKHKTFEAKRALLKEGELFLVDDRVVSEVGKSLGKMWREAKKQPIPVSLARKELKAELERAISSTYLQIGTGTSLSIKFGTTSLHSPTELLANLLALIPQLAIRLPNSGWDNLLSLHLKTSTSVALPIFNASLDEAGIFKGVSEEETLAIERRKEEKEVVRKEREEQVAIKEKRRVERSATREGKGREEKKEKKSKRKASEEGDEVVEEVVDVEITKPIVGGEEEPRKAKKSKKTKV